VPLVGRRAWACSITLSCWDELPNRLREGEMSEMPNDRYRPININTSEPPGVASGGKHAMIIHFDDAINGSFESIGAVSVWANVWILLRDREVKGIAWQFQIFWCLWGIWNCWFYKDLEQIISWIAGIILCIGNLVWWCLWIKIRSER
jgi:hypothetical protein